MPTKSLMWSMIAIGGQLSMTSKNQVIDLPILSISKHEHDDVAQSEAMDKLIRSAAELPPAFDLLRRRASLEPALAG